MKKHKILVDRKPITEKQIQSRQDFGKVLKGVKQLKPPLWKSIWFYGPIGMASVALTISASSIYANDKNKIPIDSEFDQEFISNVNVVSDEKKENTIQKVAQEEIVNLPRKKELPKAKPIEVKQKETLTKKKVVEVKKESKKEIIEEKTTLKITFPNINNVYTGDIAFSDLFSEEGITCGTNTITSFTIQYFNGTEDVQEHVEGNKIPTELVPLIKRYNHGTMIFITNIKAINEKGKIILLPSLNYIPRY